ncbi:MAG: DUF4249 family protein, partial [Bacteroidetes bacterium]|nr:DUF4249 family protein [Bacteroidota bacterium]
RRYLSDLVAVKATPPIDTLGYTVSGDGMSLFTKAHDATNSTRYYRWDFVETYIYVSQINTYFKFDKSASIYQSQEVVSRPLSEQIHTCYVTDSSTNVILNSSASITQDIINNNVIAHIPASSEKLYYRYSINVKQYALTADAYQFWLRMKKNTEQLGGIFDAQPSQLNSNIHCLSNPAEPVIGYVSACTVSQKRIFIDNAQLPGWIAPPPTCKPYIINWLEGEGIPNYLSAFIAIPVGPVAAGYDAEKKDSTYVVQVGDYDCVDCRYHNPNSTTIVPAFWK